MLRIWTQDCMSRIFPHQKPPEESSNEFSLQAAGNEIACFQIGITGPPDDLNDINIEASALSDSSRNEISKDKVEVMYAEYVPVHWHSAGNSPDDLEGKAPGFYPDPLVHSLWRDVGRVQFPEVISAWVKIRVDDDTPAGSYSGKLKINCKAGNNEVKINLKILPFSLPEKSHFLMTNWFILSLIMKFHKLEPLSDKFWKVLEIYARNLSDHRQNVILTPLFRISTTHELLDGKLKGQLIDIVETEAGKYEFGFQHFDQWIDLFIKYNFQAIEGSHLAGGSTNAAGIIFRRPGEDHADNRSFASTMDPEYRNFLEQFLKALRSHLAEKQLLDKFYLHLSDEPHGDQFEAYTSLAKFVKGITPEIHLIDAMGDGKYAPYIDHPVPLESVYENFVETSGIPQEQIWFYYCCGPTGPWPNRFIDYPLIRVRIFTWLAFKHGTPGFLHWGLNHWGWHRPIHIQHNYNPYDNTTGGSLQAGDSYLLYPPPMPDESHEPLDSIRWEIIRKAMEDYEYLYMLKELAQEGNKEAGKLMDEMNEKIVPSFTEHTRDAAYLDDFIKRAADVIARSNFQ
ncbi:DUF4091 domain-containing protein [Candidatus Poribacteria bacterium]|nr:DUF4091 domain-containing protein [Candidatus Poribacteria bacterium]